MRQRRSEAGQALFELGITLPILVALVLGVIQLGYVLFQTLLVSKRYGFLCLFVGDLYISKVIIEPGIEGQRIR